VKGKNPDDFCELLIAIFRFLNPVLTMIDAITVMDGPGPIRGRARPLGYLIGGTDPVACETLCCKLVDIEPEDLPIIRAARQADFGCSDPDRIRVVGDSLPETYRDFELPRLIPIRFSLVHVCKSICKQILMLTKSTFEKKTKQPKA
jgi:uncharacterized protein (DUF362 family)